MCLIEMETTHSLCCQNVNISTNHAALCVVITPIAVAIDLNSTLLFSFTRDVILPPSDLDCVGSPATLILTLMCGLAEESSCIRRAKETTWRKKRGAFIF